MRRKKHIKLGEVKTFPNVFSNDTVNLEDKLHKFFGNTNPITLELGCGRGDYSVSLAQEFPDKNFLGVDIKGARIWTGAKSALELKLNNAAFLITYVDNLNNLFKEIKFEEIWIPFPDPFPRHRSIKRRLVHPRFLQIYKDILMPGGKINLKTDDDILFNYTLKLINDNNLRLFKSTHNLHDSESLTSAESIKTKYEIQHLKEGRIIKYVSFGF